MDYGITRNGFIRKPYDVILAEIQAFAKSAEIFGEAIDLSDESVIGAKLKLMAWTLAKQWELAENTYYSFDIDRAEGVSLNRLTRLGFVDKKGAIKSRGHLQFSGGPHCTISPGTQAETETGIVFITTTFGITNENGDVIVEAECSIPGNIGNVSAGNISKIKTPVAGITSVTNPQDFRDGRNIETEYEQRDRFRSLPLSAGSSLDSITAKVLNDPAVIDAVGYENVENETIDGIAPGAIEIIVLGGDDNDIAKAIFSSKPAGVNTSGNVEKIVHDYRGREHIIKFSRPGILDVYIEYILSTDVNFDEIEAVGKIKEAAVGFVNSLQVASILYNWKLCNPLQEISGIINAKALVGLTPNVTVSDRLVPEPRQVYRTSIDKVVISYE